MLRSLSRMTHGQVDGSSTGNGILVKIYESNVHRKLVFSSATIIVTNGLFHHMVQLTEQGYMLKIIYYSILYYS